MTENKQEYIAEGRINRVTGSVVDVIFDEKDLPKIYDALETKIGDKKLVLEVEQLLPNNIARCLAMSDTDGLERSTPVFNTGKPISVPVGI
ncbi:MAG: F0F1 ATP synthase subunit beta, partial [Alphaproteobacteria bacterium]|nr:F0F1 ATP synthase subunit beta [Alphaproteobacteria bacterium]